jgi:hypothetical protein
MEGEHDCKEVTLKKLFPHVTVLFLFAMSLAGCSEKSSGHQVAPANTFESAMIWSGQTPAPKNLVLQCRRIDPNDGSAIYVAAIYDSTTAPENMPSSTAYQSSGGTLYKDSLIVVSTYDATGNLEKQTSSRADYFSFFAGQDRRNPKNGPFKDHSITSNQNILFDFTSENQPTPDELVSKGPVVPGLPEGAAVECQGL